MILACFWCGWGCLLLAGSFWLRFEVVVGWLWWWLFACFWSPVNCLCEADNRSLGSVHCPGYLNQTSTFSILLPLGDYKIRSNMQSRLNPLRNVIAKFVMTPCLGAYNTIVRKHQNVDKIAEKCFVVSWDMTSLSSLAENPVHWAPVILVWQDNTIQLANLWWF